ncbi:amino acid adenylation domain-containing protein [Magnetococcales bacterium HHB-1]
MDHVDLSLKSLLKKLSSLRITLSLENQKIKYSAPKGKMTPELLKQISDHKGQIIQKLTNITHDHRIITKITDQQHAPLSAAQQRLWFLDQLEQGKEATYNMPPMVWEITGTLHKRALQQSLNLILKRHKVLSSRFLLKDGQPVQVAHANPTLKMIDYDLSGASDQKAEIERLVSTQAKTPFQLTRDDHLLRIVLVRCTQNKHVLILTMHHIVSDGWSITIFLKELTVFYQNFIKSQKISPLPPLPIQYGDFAYWEQQLLDSNKLTEQKRYWRGALHNAPTLLALPTDYPRPKRQRFKGHTSSLYLSIQQSRLLNQFCIDHHVTLFMMLLALFSLLLSRYSQQDDLIIGSPIANRPPQTKDLIGLFLNTLALRVRLQKKQSFLSLLKQVKKTALEAYKNQDLPFDQLLDELKLRRNLNHTPLVQVMLVLQNAPIHPVELKDLFLKPLPTAQIHALFDLTLSVEETEKGLECKFRYNRDLFCHQRIQRMQGHFQTLLTHILKDPHQLIDHIPMLTTTEQIQQKKWNQTTRVYPENQCLHQRFERQVEKTPHANALIFNDQTLSYQQLNQQANRLAHHLIKTVGIKKETLVAICLERSLEMVIAIYAVLKAGGAYVPLDPHYPDARLSLMIQDMDTPVILSQKALYDRLTTIAPQQTIIPLDEPESIPENLTPENPEVDLNAENLAYMIYTSGSTGEPKGVLQTHINLMHRLFWMQETFSLSKEDRVLQKTPFTFDVSLWEFFWPLMIGAPLVIAKPDGHKDSAYLISLIQKERISIIHFVPAMLQIFMDTPGVTACQSLRYLLCGGESLRYELQEHIFKKLPHTELHHLYGPTEATIDVTHWPCQKNRKNRTIPIGYPLANVQLHILDRALNPLPIGVPGELHIAGSGLARGYLNQKEETEKKFINNPFDPQSRLYKTGDLVQYLEDGSIEYLDRLDYQLKIRGFRVEPGEIENRLTQHPDIASAVVMAKKEQATTYLIAYLVAKKGGSPSQQSIKTFLKQTLADYMIPSIMIFLEKLPLNANGKIDRGALPEPTIKRSPSTKNYVAPKRAVEHILADLWRAHLHVKNIGVHDHFFELGGDSIKGAILINRLQKITGERISVVAIFEAPTISKMVRYLKKHHLDAFYALEQSDNSAPSEPLTITPKPEDQPPPLSFAQQRLWFLNQLEKENITYNMPMALHIHGPLKQNLLQRALDHLVERHKTLQCAFPSRDGEPAVLYNHKSIKLHIIDLTTTENQEHAITQLLKDDLETPFNLTKGPLLRCHLILCNRETSILLINMHHIISDGWSIDILIREWSALYNAFEAEKPSPLPPMRLHYHDYAYHQQQQITQKRFKKQRAYWKKQLNDIPTLLDMPTDFLRPPEQHFSGKTLAFSIPKKMVEQLKKLGQRQDASLFMSLLSLFAILLSRYSQSEDIIIGTPIANRTSREVEQMIGFFINTLVMRLNLAGGPSFEKLLKQTRKVALEAYDHQDIPFEKLVEDLKPQRNLSHSPLFQVMFVLQNTPSTIPKLNHLKLSPLQQENTVSKFDLTLYMEETEQGLDAQLEYSCALFSKARMQRFCEQFQILLQSAIKNPEKPVDQLEVLTPQERKQLLYDWNDTEQAYSHNLTLSQQIEQQCAKTPEAIALIFKQQKLTYQELNQQANQLAHLLQQHGIGAGMIVGIYLERSVDMVIALLATLKTGATYLPLDPSFPAKRLTFMLEDASVVLLITHATLVKQLPQLNIPQLHVDRIAAILSNQRTDNPPQQATVHDLAYVIYTSGSTGKPKGVMISQRAAINFLISMGREPGLNANDRLLAVTTISFDISVLELYLPLMVGAQIILADHESSRDGPILLELMQKHQVTIMQATPATWHMLLDLDWPSMPHLKILCGGEALSLNLAKRLQPKCGSLWNMYGPTETTVWSTVESIDHLLDESTKPISIGRPIANTQIYIVDKHLNLLPTGVPGEMLIGGDGLAMGYLNRPELTREKFISNPFSEFTGTRLYRTGDLVHYGMDGRLEYKNRIDNQVKVRGFRIELGEIETLLSRHKAVQNAVVVVNQEDNETGILIAYLIYKENLEATDKQLRKMLKQHLPDYMIPTFFVTLKKFPLTPNGKVNRRALPKPDMEKQREQIITARNSTELQLVTLWEEVLQREPIGIRDNFFELGGHSLTAVRLMTRINDCFNRHLPLATLFQGATIEQLAPLVEQKDSQDHWSSCITIQPSSGEKTPIFFSAGAGGNVLYFHALAQQMGRERTIYGLQPPGLDGITPPHTTIESLATHYIKTMKKIQPHGPYILGGHSFGGLVTFEMSQQLCAENEPVEHLILLDAPAPHAYNNTNKDWNEEKWLSQIAAIIGHLYSKEINVTEASFKDLSSEEALYKLHTLLKAHDILPPQADITQFKGFVSLYKANLNVQYKPGHNNTKQDMRITLFQAEEEQPDTLKSGHISTDKEEYKTWQRYTNIPVDIVTTPGDHLTMLNMPHVKSLAQHLIKVLN